MFTLQKNLVFIVETSVSAMQQTMQGCGGNHSKLFFLFFLIGLKLFTDIFIKSLENVGLTPFANEILKIRFLVGYSTILNQHFAFFYKSLVT